MTQPFAELSFNRMFCSLHGEPFREQWPRGAILFQLKGLQAVLEKDGDDLKGLVAIVKAPEDPNTRGLELLLDRKPVCCRLPRDRLLALYTETGIGKKARCVSCHRKQLGTSLRSRQSDESVITIPHVCFSCLVFRAYEGHS